MDDRSGSMSPPWDDEGELQGHEPSAMRYLNVDRAQQE